jgi:hypothetical protein
MVRRKTDRRHMTGYYDDRTARRVTLLVTSTDEILGTDIPQGATFLPGGSAQMPTG